MTTEIHTFWPFLFETIIGSGTLKWPADLTNHLLNANGWPFYRSTTNLYINLRILTGKTNLINIDLIPDASFIWGIVENDFVVGEYPGVVQPGLVEEMNSTGKLITY